jgi:hypothetical protein
MLLQLATEVFIADQIPKEVNGQKGQMTTDLSEIHLKFSMASESWDEVWSNSNF